MKEEFWNQAERDRKEALRKMLSLLGEFGAFEMGHALYRSDIPALRIYTRPCGIFRTRHWRIAIYWLGGEIKVHCQFISDEAFGRKIAEFLQNKYPDKLVRYVKHNNRW